MVICKNIRIVWIALRHNIYIKKLLEITITAKMQSTIGANALRQFVKKWII